MDIKGILEFAKGFADPEKIPYVVVTAFLAFALLLLFGFVPHIVNYVVSKLARAGERRQATKEKKRTLRLERQVRHSFGDSVTGPEADFSAPERGEPIKLQMTSYEFKHLPRPIKVWVVGNECQGYDAKCLGFTGHGINWLDALIQLYPQLEIRVKAYFQPLKK